MSSMIDLLASEMEHGGPHVHFAGFILFILMGIGIICFSAVSSNSYAASPGSAGKTGTVPSASFRHSSVSSLASSLPNTFSASLTFFKISSTIIITVSSSLRLPIFVPIWYRYF